MAAIRRLVPNVVFEGFGGSAMEMQGLRSVARLSDLAVTGYWEVAKRLPYFKTLLRKCGELLQSRRPDLFLPVDYPGFNMRLAARARGLGIPVCWYIAPQLWAWGKNRAAELANVVDQLLVVFPFEVDYFKQFGIRAEWVGHPLQAVVSELPADRDMKRILFMPGSRKQELHRHVPLLTAVAKSLKSQDPNINIVVARAPGVDHSALKSLENQGAEITSDTFGELSNAGCGVIKAGTSTLEAAVFGLPFTTFYKTSWLTFAIGKRVVNINTVTMMNHLLGRNVVHEYIQGAAQPAALVAEVNDLMYNPVRRAELATATHNVRAILGLDGASPLPSDRAAEAIVSRFHRLTV